jgi:hypothetical protein
MEHNEYARWYAAEVSPEDAGRSVMQRWERMGELSRQALNRQWQINQNQIAAQQRPPSIFGGVFGTPFN